MALFGGWSYLLSIYGVISLSRVVSVSTLCFQSVLSVHQSQPLIIPLDFFCTFPRPVWCFFSWIKSPRMAIDNPGAGKDFFWAFGSFGLSNVPLSWPHKRTVSNGRQGYKPAPEWDFTHSTMYSRLLRQDSSPSLNDSSSPNQPFTCYMTSVDPGRALSTFRTFYTKSR